MPRPREFDEQTVLDAAIQKFWEKGYEGTSTRDLSDCMGLTAASLYNAFGDKRSLFLKALDRYLEETLRERIVRLEASLPPGRAISTYLHEIVERSLADPMHRGCLLVNSTLEAGHDDPDLQRVLAAELRLLEAFFSRTVRAAQGLGEIPPGIPAEAAAKLLLTTIMGLRTLARVRPERALLVDAARQALAGLGLPYPY